LAAFLPQEEGESQMAGHGGSPASAFPRHHAVHPAEALASGAPRGWSRDNSGKRVTELLGGERLDQEPAGALAQALQEQVRVVGSQQNEYRRLRHIVLRRTWRAKAPRGRGGIQKTVVQAWLRIAPGARAIGIGSQHRQKRARCWLSERNLSSSPI